MKKTTRSLRERSHLALRKRSLRLPLLGARIDLAFVLLTAFLFFVLGVGWTTYVTFGDRAGWFDPPIVQGLADERILTNVRDNLSTRALLDAVVHLPEDRLFMAQQGGDFHVYDPVTYLWTNESAFPPGEPIAQNFVALRSGCGAERGTTRPCPDPESLWALGDDGSLARRKDGRWQIVVANTAFLGADGTPVENADLTSAALSDDSRLLLLGTRDNGVGVYDTFNHRWLRADTVNNALKGADGTLPIIDKLVYWRGYFWAATPVGLMRIELNADDPVQRYTDISGAVLDIDRDGDVRLWVLQQQQCANIPEPTEANCTWLGVFDSPQRAPRTVIDEGNRFAAADLANLFFAQQQGDMLVLAGDGGLYTYNTTRHHWEQPYADASVNAVLPYENGEGFYFSYGSGVGSYSVSGGVKHVNEPLQTLETTEQIAQLMYGNSASEVIVVTQDVMQGLNSVYALDTRTWTYAPIHRRNRSPRDNDVGDGTQFDPATFTRALTFNDTAIFIAPNGLTLHDTRRQTFSDLVAEDVPEWLLDVNTRLVPAGNIVFALTDSSAGAEGDIYALPADRLATRDYFINKEYTNATFFESLSAPFARWWRWGNGRMGFLGRNGSVYRVTKDAVSEITGGAVTQFASARFLDVAATSDAFYLITDTDLWRYDLNERGLSHDDLGVNAEEILFEGQTLYMRTSDGQFTDERGNGIAGDLTFAMSDSSLNDVQLVGNLLYLAGAGTVEAYNLDERRITDTWNLRTQGNIILADVVNGQPLTLVGGRALLGDDPLSANAGTVTALSHDGSMIWTVREDGEQAWIMGHSLAAPYSSEASVCYFRHPNAGANVTEVWDARSLPDSGAVIVLTNGGVKAYDPTARSWSAPSARVPTAERVFYLHGTDGDYLLLVSAVSGGFDLSFAPVADIELPHSCDANARLGMRVSQAFRVRDYTVDESADRAAWVLMNGEVEVWQNGQRSTVLAEVTNVETTAFRRVFDRQTSGYLLFATTNELWRYNLADRSWQQIGLTTPARITDLNVERDNAREIITAHDMNGVPYFGVYNPTGRSSVALEPILNTAAITVSGMEADALLDVQARVTDKSVWTFVLDDQVLYYNPDTRMWTRSSTFPTDPTRQFLRIPDRGIIEADGGRTWWMARETDDHPVNFVAYTRNEADQQEAFTTTDGDVWRLDDGGTVLRCRVLAESGCGVVHTTFDLNPDTVEYAINWTAGDAVLFVTTGGLRWFDVSSGTETDLPDASANFTNLDATLVYEDDLLLYSQRNSSLLVMTTSGAATFNGVTDFRTDIDGRPWALFADGWRPYLNGAFPLVTPGTPGFRLFVGWGSPVTGVDGQGKVYLWQTDTLMIEDLPLPPEIPSASVDFIVRESGGNYWVLAGDQLYPVIREQCTAPDQRFPFSTAVAISTATESARATEFQSTAAARATYAAATLSPQQTASASTAQAASTQTAAALTATHAAELTAEPSTEEATLAPAAPTPTASEPPTPTFTFTPTYTPSPEPIPCLYVVRQPFTVTLTDIVSASSAVDGAAQLVDSGGTVAQVSLNQSTPTVTVDPAHLPVYRIDDAWGTLQANLITLPNGTTAYDPVTALTIDANGVLFARRAAGIEHQLATSAVFPDRLELPPALDAGWLRWLREDRVFEVNTGNGAQTFSPQQFIQNGQLLFEPVNRVIAFRPDRFVAANAFGLWEFESPTLRLIDPTIRYFPYEIPLPITAAHGMFMSNGQAYTTGAAPQSVPTYQFQVGDVQFTEQPDTPTLAAEASINGTATDILTAKGFLWDVDRRGVAFDQGALLLQSDIGVHLVERLAAFDTGPFQLALGNGVLEGDSAGSAYLFDPSSRTWYQLQNGSWMANAPDPHQNRALVTTGLWNWILQGGVLNITLTRDPFSFSFNTRNFGFNFDHLRGAASFGGALYVMTDAFFETGSPGQIAALQSARSAPLDTDRLETVRFADGQRLYLFDGGNAYRWDNAAGQFTLENFDPERDRPLVIQDRLRFTLMNGQVLKEVRFDEFSGGSAWVPFEFTPEHRFPFDHVYNTQQFDNRLYLGSALGLQEYLSPSSVGWSSLTALYRFGVEASDYETVKRVGIPEANPALLMAQSDSVCMERASGGHFTACADASSLAWRVRVDTPLWHWVEAQSGAISGRYYTATGALDTVNIDGTGGRFPHDRITDAMVCSGQAFTLWEDRWISVYPGEDMTLNGVRNFALETSPARFLCFEQPISYADATIPSGTYYQDDTGATFMLSAQGWRPVTDMRVLARLAEYTARPPVLERSRARFLPAASGYTFEQRGLDDEWREIPWQYDPVTATWSPDINFWSTVARVGDQFWAATSGGLINFYRDAEGAYLDLDNLIVVREPLAGELRCQVSDLQAEGETVYARCNQNSGQVFSGVLSLTNDVNVFQPYPRDPFAEERWINVRDNGYWQWTMVDRSDGDTGRLMLEFSGAGTTLESMPLENGRFAFDTLDSLALFYPDRLDVATIQGGWFFVPRDSQRVRDFARPLVGDNTGYTHVHLTRVTRQSVQPGQPNMDELQLCVQTTDGSYVSFSQRGQESPQPCAEYLGEELLWSYARDGETVSITAPFSVGGAAVRTLTNGRFADDTVIGLPITGGDGDTVRYWVPTRSGVIEFNANMQGTTIHGGVFPGLANDEVPSALFALDDARPTYWGSGTLYTLDENREPALTLVEDDGNSIAPTVIQPAPNDSIRLRWNQPGLLGWTYFGNAAPLYQNRLDVDIQAFPRYIQRRGEWILPTTLLTLTFADHRVLVSAGAESLCLLPLPDTFTLIDALVFERRVLLIGARDALEINLDPLILAILNGTCRLQPGM